MRIALAALALLGHLCAQSPNPSQVQRIGDQDHPKSNADGGKGTQTMPQPTGAVKPTTGSVEQVPAAQVKYQTNTYTPSRTDISNWALVIVGIGGIAAAVWTVLEIRQEAKIANVAANAAKLSAEAANKSILLTYRPHLIVRQFRPDSEDFIKEGTVPEGYFSIVNVGSTDALVQDYHAGIWCAHVMPATPPYERTIAHTLDAALRLTPGQSATVSFAGQAALSDGNINALRFGVALPDNPTSAFLHVFGFVNYADDQGVPRCTGFCQRFDGKRNRFAATEDPDYEYAD
jgi:hypothetical protein